jgi:hypothetical protein
MTHDELCGHVADVLALPLGDSQTLRALLSRVNCADLDQLLAAAFSVARSQANQKIAELERALDDSEQDRWRVEDEMQELRELIHRKFGGRGRGHQLATREIKRLAHKRETKGKSR